MKTRISPKNWLLVPVSIVLLYLLIEAIVYLFICFTVLRPDFFSLDGGILAATDRPYTRFDSISGYKYIPGSPRLVTISDDSLVIDHRMHINSRGYSSIYDYNFGKRAGVKRWMVIGDSYSAGEITDSTWVDLLQRQIGTDSVELYNFSLHGSGIAGWHHIFFKEIIPAYDFDGIILPISGERALSSFDLARSFVMVHSLPDRTFTFYFDSLPRTTQDFYTRYLDKMCCSSVVYPSSEIDRYEERMLQGKHRGEFRFMPVHFYFAQYAMDIWHTYSIMKAGSRSERAQLNRSLPPVPAGNDTTLRDYDIMWGADHLRLAHEMLEYCAAHGKQVCLISIPSVDVASADTVFFHDNVYNRYLRGLADQYHCRYFDGYMIYDSIPPAQRGQYHLYGDDHWNRKAIDIFVRKLSKQNILH